MKTIEHLVQLDKSRPTVFLDLCGVIADTYYTRPRGISRLLNNEQYVLTHPDYLGDRVHIPTWTYLRSLFLEYKVQVIIVSSWVRSYLSSDASDIVRLKDFLGYSDILGSIYTGGGYDRGECVKASVETLGISDWLVIDDARDQMYEDRVFFNNNRFIHPHGRYGLGSMELEKIDYLLSKQRCEFLDGLFKLSYPT